MLVTRDNFNFDKLYLTKDSEYGTHVLYCDNIFYEENNKVKYYNILINTWCCEDNFFELIDYIIEKINIQIIKDDDYE